MTPYTRTVLLRGAGALAGTSIWFGLIVLALANFDSPIGVPGSIAATWPFWALAILVAGVVYLALRRAGPGPGWGAFSIGLTAPFLALVVNGVLRDVGAILFWLVILIVILVPLPRRAEATADA